MCKKWVYDADGCCPEFEIFTNQVAELAVQRMGDTPVQNFSREDKEHLEYHIRHALWEIADVVKENK